jgi:hypothetical protein
MRRSTLLWILALFVTLAAAVWQERTGPTYPVRGQVTLGGQVFNLKLTRSWDVGDQPIQLNVSDPAVHARLRWRRYPTSEPWQVIAMARSADVLQASLPHQPPAGKLEYQVELAREQERVIFPARPAVTRFKGLVSPAVLVPHIFTIFLGMLFSTRTALEAVANGPSRRVLTWLTLLFIVVGGLVLGPLVQKAAFGAYWTGVPWGYDLTDNKTLIMAVAWVWAAWRISRSRAARWSLVFAALVTLAVFVIPHSAWGSEIKWEG